ncbi:hypothetical protein [Sphingomonas sp. TZW2008]|uniref:hypothetical protein n=1 Tax=Sphingomonas sp. TZW2008 TaxID=1917973 RepID=UPI000A26D073|nr:hypothetical protein [Sphingomonas sp. TZW2008]
MLAGLIFAVQDAEDRPGALAATLPFAGMTVIEYQARLLIDAGASQIVVVVARLTPELLGAVARIGRRGVTIDTVRSAADASARLHPLSHLLVLADGLVTTQTVLAPVVRTPGDVMLVVADGEATAGYERVGGGQAWAGVARLDGRRLAEVAAMPRDYDVQSALLHAAAQAGARRLVLPDDEGRAGHGIERRRDALEARSRAVVSATLAARIGWFDRWMVKPLARLTLPPLMRRHVPTPALASGAALVALGGLGALWAGHLTAGLLAALVGVATAALASSFAWLRDETALARALGWLILGVPAAAELLLGHVLDAETGERTATVLALALAVAGGLGTRAIGEAREPWWGDPPGYLLLLAAATILGLPLLGLALTGVYAAVTLGHAIERLRARGLAAL